MKHNLRHRIARASGSIEYEPVGAEYTFSGGYAKIPIIHYNATILSSLLAHRESTGDVPGADLIKQVSPVAWPHINLHGRFEFRKQPEPLDMEAIVRELAQTQAATNPALAA